MSAGKGKVANTRGHEIYTMFVDNIPWSMSPKDLHYLFVKFGVVRDVFIPNKTRKTSRSRFGFVRYGCSIAVSVAIQKANGLWCDDKAIKVKAAEFERRAPAEIRGTAGLKRVKNLLAPTDTTMYTRRSELVDIGVKSYVDAIQGGLCRKVVKHEIIATEAGNGWLFDSLIVKLKSHHIFSEFRMTVLAKGSGEVIVRKGGGGRQAIVSFSSRAHLEENQLLIQECWKDWCESVTEWKKGDYVE
ncbi:uncharacterized protein LOC114323935 [Camellia sinensis]|uniref:uncharacterized protein LOC114323935 n=1 Tax=Camellia sinensis TaxID=4442 RepID=UPI0010363CD2|nr:uncharacterized protein LOC114323935 [Camellia sinensis]